MMSLTSTCIVVFFIVVECRYRCHRWSSTLLLVRIIVIVIVCRYRRCFIIVCRRRSFPPFYFHAIEQFGHEVSQSGGGEEDDDLVPPATSSGSGSSTTAARLAIKDTEQITYQFALTRDHELLLHVPGTVAKNSRVWRVSPLGSQQEQTRPRRGQGNRGWTCAPPAARSPFWR